MGLSHKDIVGKDGKPMRFATCIRTTPLCNDKVKVVGINFLQPYTFGMDRSQWESVKKNALLEYNLALVFALENETSALTEGSIHRYEFDTMMYLKFARFVKANYKQAAAVIVAKFEAASLTYAPSFKVKEAKENFELAFEYMNTALLMANAVAIANNYEQPTILNEKMYRKAFLQNYDKKALQLMKQQGLA